jgi:replicative DNA helicase
VQKPIPLSDARRPDFPEDVLPMRLRDVVRAVAAATQTPLVLPVYLALAVIASTLAKRIKIVLRGFWREPVNVFLLVALGPANRKSAVAGYITAPVEHWEAEQARRVGPLAAEARSRRKVLEHQLAKAEQAAAKATPDEGVARLKEVDKLARELESLAAPDPPRLFADDVTPEQLTTLLARHGGRMAIISPEGGLFDNLVRYSASGLPNLETLLKAHASDASRVDRVGRPPEIIRSPALTLGLAVQPSVLAGLMARPGFAGRGLLARFAYALPESLIGRRRIDAPPLGPTVLDDWNALVRALLALPTAVDRHGEPVPHEIRLSPKAQVAFDAFETALERRLGPGGDLAAHVDWGGKLAGLTGRIAALFHAVETAGSQLPWDVPISDATMTAAIELAETYLIPHALAAFAAMQADPVIADAERILAYLELQQLPTVSRRELFIALRGRFKRVSALDPALVVLVEHGYLIEQHADARPGPGRKPSPVFAVHPRVLGRDRCRSGQDGDDSVHSVDSAFGTSDAAAGGEA